MSASRLEYGELLREYYWVVLMGIFAFLGSIIICIWAIVRCKHPPSYQYAVLDEEVGVPPPDSTSPSFLLLERPPPKPASADGERNEPLINCQYYLRGSTRYFLRYQLNDLGSRMGRHWFLVRDTNTKTERLLTLTALPDACPLRNSCHTRHALQEIFQGLQHPYIYPTLDIDIKVLAERQHVVVVTPLNGIGTLKDVVYHSKFNESWQEKYRHGGQMNLSTEPIRRICKQIIEALLFLEEQGFPTLSFLHLGNVIIQNGVARLTGLENDLLGLTPRISSFVPRRYIDNQRTGPTVCFGHTLFEMTTGYELTSLRPTEKNFQDLENFPEINDVLHYIFDDDDQGFPTLKTLSNHHFFRNIDLREIQAHALPIQLVKPLSLSARRLLKDIQQFYIHRIRLRRTHSISMGELSTSYDSDSAGGRFMERRWPAPSRVRKLIASQVEEQLRHQQGISTPTEHKERNDQSNLYVSFEDEEKEKDMVKKHVKNSDLNNSDNFKTSRLKSSRRTRDREDHSDDNELEMQSITRKKSETKRASIAQPLPRQLQVETDEELDTNNDADVEEDDGFESNNNNNINNNNSNNNYDSGNNNMTDTSGDSSSNTATSSKISNSANNHKKKNSNNNEKDVTLSHAGSRSNNNITYSGAAPISHPLVENSEKVARPSSSASLSQNNSRLRQLSISNDQLNNSENPETTSFAADSLTEDPLTRQDSLDEESESVAFVAASSVPCGDDLKDNKTVREMSFQPFSTHTVQHLPQQLSTIHELTTPRGDLHWQQQSSVSTIASFDYHTPPTSPVHDTNQGATMNNYSIRQKALSDENFASEQALLAAASAMVESNSTAAELVKQLQRRGLLAKGYSLDASVPL